MFFILCIVIFEVSSKQSYVKCSFIKKLSFRNITTQAIMRNLLLKKLKSQKKELQWKNFNSKSTATIYKKKKKKIVNTVS